MPNAFTQHPRHIQGRILILAGSAICVFGLLFVTRWSPNAPLMTNLTRIGEIEILAGQQVIVGKNPAIPPYGGLPGLPESNIYETQGRVTIPLRLILILGLSIIFVGLVFIVIPKQE